MSLADFAPADRPVRVHPATALRSLVGWLASRRIARARKAAQQDLLFAPEHRLRDLGITRDELLTAIDGRGF